jgi:hypothetical protein
MPTPASGLSFYGSDVNNGVVDQTSWTSSKNLNFLTCSSDYTNIWGI